MEKDRAIVFDRILIRYTKIIEQTIKSRMKKARDKEVVRQQIESELDFHINLLQLDHTKLLETFSTQYKRGEEIENILKLIRKTFGEDVPDILPFKKIENGKSIPLYISEEDKTLKQLALNDKKLLKFILRYISITDIKKRLPELCNETEKQEIKKQHHLIVKWTGNKDNKNEFVQLVYGLHQAG